VSSRILLTDTASQSRAEIDPVGASLVSLILRGTQVIEPLAGSNPALFAGVALAPWSNRIKNGQWVCPEGRTLSLPINESDKNNALHGLVFDRDFSVSIISENSAEFEITILATSGYPYPLAYTVSYEILDGELICRYRASNLSGTQAPFGTAFHPYFVLPEVAIENLRLKSDARTVSLKDEQFIPTGVMATSGTDMDLSNGKKVVAAGLDDNFTDLEFVNGKASTWLVDDNGKGLELWQDQSFPHLLIYTTDSYPGVSGTRTSVAIEPSTSAVNAFNNNIDLVWLEPGASKSGSWGVRLT